MSHESSVLKVKVSGLKAMNLNLKDPLGSHSKNQFYSFVPFSLSSPMVGQFLALAQEWQKKDKITCKFLMLHRFLHSKFFFPLASSNDLLLVKQTCPC